MAVATGINPAFSREKILQIARALPADLQVLSALGEMLQDVNSELEEIATLLRRDVALAARIVRIANSPMIGGNGQIASVEEAVNRVGFSEILKLVGTASAARFAERALELYRVDAERLRDNMLYTAFAAETLGRFAGLDARLAYTAGLMRPLGLMVLDRAARNQPGAAVPFEIARHPHYVAWEREHFQTTSGQVAALIMEEWRFPKEVRAALRSQYLSQPSELELPLACVLNLASSLAHARERGLAGEACWWELNVTKLRGANVSHDDLEVAGDAAEAAFQEAVAALAG